MQILKTHGAMFAIRSIFLQSGILSSVLYCFLGKKKTQLKKKKNPQKTTNQQTNSPHPPPAKKIEKKKKKEKATKLITNSLFRKKTVYSLNFMLSDSSSKFTRTAHRA